MPVAMPGISFSSPLPGQEVPIGSTLVVSGLAWGVQSGEPNIVEQVDLSFLGQVIPAQLGPPPKPEPAAKSFTANVTVPSQAPFSTLPITATSTLTSGNKVSATVTFVVSPVNLPIQPGFAWTNQTNSLTFTPQFFCIPKTLSDIVGIVRYAEQNNGRVHAFGTSWSYSDCLKSSSYLMDTRFAQPLETSDPQDPNKKVPLISLALNPGATRNLVHIQAGMSIRALYQYADSRGFALETMGGSSGQTIAGAISTGTHGGDFTMGPLADSVLALHIVGAGGIQYWIEPSAGITDPTLLRQFVVPDLSPGNIIYDDTLFNASLVALGCMGIVYAIVLRVAPRYDLIETTSAISWNDFKANFAQRLQGWRFAQLAINPYAGPDDPSCVLRLRKQSELPPTMNAVRPSFSLVGPVFGLFVKMFVIDVIAAADVVSHFFTSINNQSISDEQKLVLLVQYVLTNHLNLWPALANSYASFLAEQLPVATIQGLAHSVMDSDFNQQPLVTQKPSWSMESFFPFSFANGSPAFQFIDAIKTRIAPTLNSFLVGYVSLRLCGKTRALLGGQQFDPTCAVEISALQGVNGVQQMVSSLSALAWDSFKAIPHWGQVLDQGTASDPSIYPGYEAWRGAYSRLSSGMTQRTFENDLSIRWKLTTP